MLNQGINIGHSDRPIYDNCYYNEKLEESTAPLLYKLNPINNTNCEKCLSVFGPRSSHNGHGVSTFSKNNSIAPAQQLVGLESILTNRNMKLSRCKDGKVNNADLSKYKLHHSKICNDFLDPISTRLTNPSSNYRGMSINRFYDLPKDPQANIFYDFARNTTLEAKDNYRERIPNLRPYDATLPIELKGRNKPCRYNCNYDCSHN